jgi:hypothetical protein
MFNGVDNDERTFEVTGVRNDNSSSLFEKVERGGHGGLRESYCQLCTIDEVIYGLSHGEIIASVCSMRGAHLLFLATFV